MCTKKTPLFDEHEQLGGKIVDFAGYLLPIQYPQGTSKEHIAVREKAGLFDVSHMGEFLLEGPGSGAFLDYLLTNILSNLKESRIRYAIMCYENGTCVDDLLVYRLAEEKLLLVVNAANRQKDFDWIQEQIAKWDGEEVSLSDLSDEYALIAIQGPASKEIIKELVPAEKLPKKYYSFTENVGLFGKNVLLSRTGYTGEFGYEIYCKPEDAVSIWKGLLEAGEAEGLIPCGLGARDTLRLEAGMCLYGHELSEEIKASEADVDFAIRLDKDEFIGKEALAEEPAYERIGLELEDRGIMRQGFPVYAGEEEIGSITSGTLSPSTKRSIAMARVKKIDDLTQITVAIRGKKVKVKHVKIPFVEKD